MSLQDLPGCWAAYPLMTIDRPDIPPRLTTSCVNLHKFIAASASVMKERSRIPELVPSISIGGKFSIILQIFHMEVLVASA